MTRKVIIAARRHLEDTERVLHSDYVRKLWLLPRDYALIEFYHPVFEFTRNPSFAAQWSESIRQSAAEAVKREKELFSPLYKKVRSPSSALMLLIPSRTAMYEFIGEGKGKVDWPDLGCSPDWESSKDIRLVVRLDHQSKDMARRVTLMESIFSEWLGTMSELGVHVSEIKSTVVGSHFSKSLKFDQASGDACMAFYMLVTVAQGRSGTDCVGFFRADDYDSPFLQIGGTRRTDQLRSND